MQDMLIIFGVNGACFTSSQWCSSCWFKLVFIYECVKYFSQKKLNGTRNAHIILFDSLHYIEKS